MSGANLDAFVHPEFFETIDRYEPLDDLRSLVASLVPDGWSFPRNGVWFGCQPPSEQFVRPPAQGWKIHVSSSVERSEALLRAVVPVLAAHTVSFKFALDSRMLAFMNGKAWLRQGSGKFLTIYPRGEAEFVELIEALHQATRGFDGPYILSDRRYKDSRVVFYRYGGITPHPVLTVQGEPRHMLVSPTGELVPDQRVPYVVMPPWVQDPFGTAPPPDAPSEVALKDGRYVVRSVLRYSNSGGIYVARDTTTGQDVVVKESRPMVSSTEDATELLRKEFRLLTKIAHLGVAPKPIDLFQDWEHVFLVQELIAGEDLMTFSTRHNIALLPEATIEDTRRFYEQFKQIFLQLAHTLERLHAHGIVFADLSPTNVIVDPETMKLTILDFEAAFEEGIDRPVPLFTEGFAFIDQAQGKPSTIESDYFAIGALMHFLLWPINHLFMLNPKARYTFLPSVLKDIGFPDSIRELVAALLDREAAKRPTPAEIVSVLSRDEPVAEPWTEVDVWTPDDPAVTAQLNDIVTDILRYTEAMSDYERRDRLFPADGMIFRTNPLSVAYGAAGLAYVQHRVGADPSRVVSWMRAGRLDPEQQPPGLYLGLAGVAWTLMELGLREPAERVLQLACTHPLRDESADIFQGLAGIGLTSLRFFAATQDERHLDQARDAGGHLLEIRTEDDAGCYWMSGKDIPLGFGHGASGIALFLFHLWQATGDEQFLRIGRRGLDYDLSQGMTSGSGISWPRMVSRRHIIYPYWRVGSAGVGTTLLRYARLQDDPADRAMLDRILLDTNRKYAIFPGFFAGLSGLGEFMLDAYAFTGDARFLQGAYRAASGIVPFRIERPAGSAFPGETLRRISCDYGTGSAGVAHFLHRLTHREMTAAFMLDGCFERDVQAARTPAAAVAG